MSKRCGVCSGCCDPGYGWKPAPCVNEAPEPEHEVAERKRRQKEWARVTSAWDCRCSDTHPYRCPVCELHWLEAELEALRAELAARLPSVNARHLLE